MSKIGCVYVTSSQFKREENEVFRAHARLADGRLVEDVFEFEIVGLPIKEVLEVDLATMVMAEVTAAYSQLRVPCIVEHAGLIFDDYAEISYPGGLTKPMWNALGEKFVEETHSADRRARARAVVAYCDGMAVRTFVGETVGRIAPAPRGERAFYWDTVFIPDIDGAPGGLTYAEYVADPNFGLEYKVRELSQSSKAMAAYLEFRAASAPAALWPGRR
jgi:XTP/dITP diphosphohydrolase